MIDIRPSRPEEADAQKRLWRQVFGDDPQFIDWFYQCCWHPEDTLLLLEDGVMVSMVSFLPQSLTLPGGESLKAYYMYGLATDPAARGKGYARRLMSEVDYYLSDREVDCATLLPAEPSLYKFFGAIGYVTGFSVRKVELLPDECRPPQPGDLAQPVSPEAYNAIRNRLLAGTSAVTYGTELVRFQEGMCRLANGGLYRVVVDGVEGCAAVEYLDEESVLFKELLLPPAQMAGALAVFFQLLPGRRCHVRSPGCWEGLPGSYLQPFGVLKWYHPEKARLWPEDTRGYMGLAFD